VKKPKIDDWVLTHTGRHFRPLTPEPHQVCIEDIAHALSMQCRFTGHTRTFYSVAQHCILASRIAPALPRMKLIALLHDATEAYLCDIASPVKRQRQFAAYRQAEARLWKAICYRYNIPSVLPPAIEEIDRKLCTTEAYYLMPNMPQAWHDQVGPGYTVEELERVGLTTKSFGPVPPELIRDEFIERFKSLGGR
jgi:hypothetical protein